MEIFLERVEPEKKDILFRLLQYSLFEESISDGNEMTEEALFSYPWFDAYFTEEEREAYFIREKSAGRLLGFVMINTYTRKSGGGHSIAEFMVLPSHRRAGIGRRAAVLCFDLHRGSWEVSPAYESAQAYLFWKKVIDRYTKGANRYEEGIFLFSNGGEE